MTVHESDIHRLLDIRKRERERAEARSRRVRRWGAVLVWVRPVLAVTAIVGAVTVVW